MRKRTQPSLRRSLGSAPLQRATYKLGPFGSNLIGEWLEYRETDYAKPPEEPWSSTASAGYLHNDHYITKILNAYDDQPRPYIFTDVDAEYGDRYRETGVRSIHPEIPFWDCMCHNVPGDLYNMRRFHLTEDIWD